MCVAQCDVDTSTSLAGATRAAQCVCLPGFFRAEGSVVRFANETKCRGCPANAYCEGAQAPPRAQQGFQRDAHDPLLFHACPNSDACEGHMHARACALSVAADALVLPLLCRPARGQLLARL